MEQKAQTTTSGTDRIVATIPFNSKRKKATTAVLIPGGNDDVVRVFVKGAPEYMLDLCTEVIAADGKSIKLDTHKK